MCRHRRMGSTTCLVVGPIRLLTKGGLLCHFVASVLLADSRTVLYWSYSGYMSCSNDDCGRDVGFPAGAFGRIDPNRVLGELSGGRIRTMENNGADIITISYYAANSAKFVEDTVAASMSDARCRFTALLPEGGTVLDWGCGSGRDAKAMAEANFNVVAVDASPVMCDIASRYANVPIRCESFFELDERNAYDGIWACASLLHLRREQLPEALARASRALKPGGVLYASFKLGDFGGYRNGRWFTDLRVDDLSVLLPMTSWQLLESWESADVREGRDGERWLNFLARKVPC